jgi:hypothetical protein
MRYASNRTGNTQIANLLQHLLDAIIQIALGVLVARLGIKILLDLRHARVCLCAEAQLNFDKGLEAGIEVRHAQVDELREFVEELLVQLLVGMLGHFSFALCARQLGHVLVGFLGELLDLGTHRVVVQELVVAFLDAFVYVGEVGAEAGDGVEDRRASVVRLGFFGGGGGCWAGAYR